MMLEKQVTLGLDAPPEARVLGHALELRRVFQNLLDNAVKFSPEGGEVRIRVQRDDESLSAQGMTLSICDDGPGVPEALVHRLFERFSHARAGGGSGLGLYLSRQLVAAHGGTISYRPGDAGGSCFTVWLPVAKEVVSA